MEEDPNIAAIRAAAEATGIPFQYLLDTASRESELNPNAVNPATNATGLFQITPDTFLGLVRAYGAQHGLELEAGQIGRNRRVADRNVRQAILNLRLDPRINALMAAELTRENQTSLQNRLRRPVAAGDLYVSHFMGAPGAVRLIRAAERGVEDAAAMFPAAAAANPSIFYRGRGNNRIPRTAQEVYQVLSRSPEPTTQPFVRGELPQPEVLTEQEAGLDISNVPTLVRRRQNIELPSPGLPEEIVFQYDQQGRLGLVEPEQQARPSNRPAEPTNRPNMASVLRAFAQNVLGERNRFRPRPLQTPEPLQFETPPSTVSEREAGRLSAFGGSGVSPTQMPPVPPTRPLSSSSVFAPVVPPSYEPPSYAMGGYVGPNGQPVMPAGLNMRSAPPEVGMDVTPEQIDQTVNQTMQANPQMVQQIQQLIMESVQSGELTMQELNTLGQMAQAALQDPNLYPQLRQMAIREGLATEQDIPPQFDAALITVMLVAIRSVKGMGQQEQAQPPMMSMAMGGVVPISKQQNVDKRHSKEVIAALEEGEYVIPKGVVREKGTAFFDGLIKKYNEREKGLS